MYTEIKYLYLKQHSVTVGLTDAQLLEMTNTVKVKNVKKGESVYMEDGFESRIYLLVKGKIKISEVDDRGDELIKEILTATEIFGDVSLDGSISDDEFAEALTENTVVCSFRSSEFKQLMQANVVLAMNFIQQVSGKFRRLENRHSNLVFKDAKSRLISFFRDWAKRAPIVLVYGVLLIVVDTLPINLTKSRWLAWFRRLRPLALMFGLGLGLSAFFWLPALLERDLSQLERALSSAYDYRNYFLNLDTLLAGPHAIDPYLVNATVTPSLSWLGLSLALLGWTRLWTSLSRWPACRPRP